MVAAVYVNTGVGGGGSAAPDVTPYRGQVTSVPPNSEMTVVSRLVPVGFSMKLYQALVSGNEAAEWILYDDGVEVLRSRTSPAERGKPILESANPIPFASGHTVSLAVVHNATDTVLGSTSRNFYATLLGTDA